LPPLLINQDVCRLEVTMNDTALMRVLHRVRQGRHQTGEFSTVHRDSVQVLSETLAFDQLHGQEPL
jgi:hypothetical protein